MKGPSSTKRLREYPELKQLAKKAAIATKGKRGHQKALASARLATLQAEIAERKAEKAR